MLDDIAKDELRAEALRLLQLAEGKSEDPNEIAEALYRLSAFVPECTPDAVREDNDERDLQEIPFLSEAFLYPLLGKMDARTVLSMWSGILEAHGFKEWPESVSIRRAVAGPWIEIEDRTPDELARGIRLGFIEEDGEGGHRLTKSGERRKARAGETRVHERKLWGIEIQGIRIPFERSLGFMEDLRHMARRSHTPYRLLLEPLKEGGEPESIGDTQAGRKRAAKVKRSVAERLESMSTSGMQRGKLRMLCAELARELRGLE